MFFLVLKARRPAGSVKKVFLGVLFVCSIGFIPTGWGVYILTNGYLDTGKETKRIQTVTDIYPVGWHTRFSRGTSHRMEVPSWRSDVSKLKVEIDKDLYNSLKKGENVELITKPSYWNIEWQTSGWHVPSQN
jgi:hypothetical protein